VSENIKKALLAGLLGVLGFYVGLSVWDALAQVSSSAPESGAGPYSYDGLTFPNAKAVWEYQRFVRAGRFYPWLLGVHDDMAPLLLGAGLGMAGGAVELFRRWLHRKHTFGLGQSFSYPLLGAITGFMVLFTMVALPLVADRVAVSLLAGVAFFSGVFSEAAFAWVTSRWDTWFGTRNSGGTATQTRDPNKQEPEQTAPPKGKARRSK